MNIINILGSIIKNRENELKNWFKTEYHDKKPHFYSSMDLRFSGYKIAPVDYNIFPAGFNNLSEKSLLEAKILANETLKNDYGNPKKILIIPENHTRNQKYFKNLVNIRNILLEHNREVYFGSLAENKDVEFEEMELFNIKRDGNNLYIENKNGKFTPDLIISNNDFTTPYPEILDNINQIIAPSPKNGWYRRSKKNYFEAFDKVAAKFAADFGFDKWFISAYYDFVSGVDFKNRVNIDKIEEKAVEIFDSINKKYREYGISDQPKIFIKADNGTYGMGVMSIDSVEDLKNLNKNIRNKMNIIKSHVQNERILIQEGVRTIDKFGDSPAEPMIYMIKDKVIGNLFRFNSERNDYESLNATGMDVVDIENPLLKFDYCQNCDKKHITNLYNLIAKLTTLAGTIENFGDD